MRSKKGVFTCIQCFLTSQSNSLIIRAEFPMFGVFIEALASLSADDDLMNTCDPHHKS